MAYPCVPFLSQLTGDTKLDVRAIYRRPSGDLAALPMRRHHQWEAKGFQYVTLADAESLRVASPLIAQAQLRPQTFIVGIDENGEQTPWLADLYVAEQADRQAAADLELRALIDAHGVETVEAIRGPIPERLKADKKPKVARKGEAA